MKLKKEFVVHNSEKGTMLVATGKAVFSGIVKGNKMFGNILALLKNDTTEEAIVQKLLSEYDAPREKVQEDVEKVIAGLRKIGAIDG